MTLPRMTLAQTVANWFLGSPDWPFRVDVDREIEDFFGADADEDASRFGRDEVRAQMEAFVGEHPEARLG